ncbi:MAG: GFA family protein [Pseudomonadota bacterium]
MPTRILTGRCYCGSTTLCAEAEPVVVSYCHCADCRRWTGAPLPAFAAFPTDALTISPDPGPVAFVPGVERWFCRECGSPMAARFDYLPGQIYVPVGVLDQAAEFPPTMHAHAEAALPWLALSDALPRHHGSARDSLVHKGGATT